MTILAYQNETSSVFVSLRQNYSVSDGTELTKNSLLSAKHKKLVTIRPSTPYKNFYRDYHSYIAVVFISVVLVIIAGSVIYVGLRKRKQKQMQKQSYLAKKKRKLMKRPLSRQSSKGTLHNYESFSSRRNNNKHARLTSQRSWADSPLTGIDSPFHEEILNKSLPSDINSKGDNFHIFLPNLSAYQSPQNISFASVSDDMNSSTSELAKLCRQESSPGFEVRSESVSPASVSENAQHHIPLTKLKSTDKGIIVQISSMDLISTAIPRSPFSARRIKAPSPSPSAASSSKSSNENITQSLEVKPMGTIAE